MPLSPDAIVQELLARGITPDQIAAANPAIGRRVQAGMIAPRLQAPDKIAERSAYTRDYGKINDSREGLARVYPMTADLDRFHALNVQKGTGGIENQDYDGFERLNPLNWPGMVANTWEKRNPNIKEMAGIASGLQGKARPVGSGATSDFEQRLYRQGVPSPEKEGPINDSIIAYQKGVMNEESDRLAFQEEFLRRNGSLSGSQQAWGRYVAANPYTVTGEGGRSALNSRRADWKQHFGIAAANAPPARPKGWTNQLPKPQLAAAKLYAGSKGANGSKGNPFIPASAAEFKNLPAGAFYIDDDGKVYQKGGR